jgi:alkaline phosphatase D
MGIDRRTVLQYGAGLAGGIGTSLGAPAVMAADATRPNIVGGTMTGDVLADRAVIWARADRPSRMLIEWSLHADFRDAQRVRGPHALEVSDFTARVDLGGLPPNRELFYRVVFEDLLSGRAKSEPVAGRFETAAPGFGERGDGQARKRRDGVRFLWSGDTAGQNFGINPDFGGMRIYETMRRTDPDFFVHCGDTIYADGPLTEVRTLDDGTVWRNLVTPEKSKVAETLDEFRGNYRYNLLDEHVRRFNADVPQVWLWDDHEVTNNWSSAKDLSADARYTVKDVALLIARGTRAFLEYAPLRWRGADELERVYRHLPQGPLMDLFAIDMRSYRGPNTFNRQDMPSEEAAILGRAQLEWLKRGLLTSRGLWKVIAADMPIGLLVGDGRDAQGRDRYEAVANGNGPVLGREFEFAELFSFIKRHRIRNVVWVTADVHYTAAHHYAPERAVFTDFDPFWEFVSGPLNAGSFGPGTLDNTFGPEVVFQKFPPRPNTAPTAGLQFFGQVDIDGRSGVMTVGLKDIAGATLWQRQLDPRRG